MKITKDMLIADALKCGNAEEIANVLFSVGMHSRRQTQRSGREITTAHIRRDKGRGSQGPRPFACGMRSGGNGRKRILYLLQ